jgi:hypothetical protein
LMRSRIRRFGLVVAGFVAGGGSKFDGRGFTCHPSVSAPVSIVSSIQR